jgi:hypothetical protein
MRFMGGNHGFVLPERNAAAKGKNNYGDSGAMRQNDA